MKAYIVQALDGLTEEEAVEQRDIAVRKLRDRGYEVINPVIYDDSGEYGEKITKGITHISLFFLAYSITQISKCDMVYFCKGYRQETICRLLYRIVNIYRIPSVDEEIVEKMEPVTNSILRGA